MSINHLISHSPQWVNQWVTLSTCSYKMQSNCNGLFLDLLLIRSLIHNCPQHSTDHWASTMFAYLFSFDEHFSIGNRHFPARTSIIICVRVSFVTTICFRFDITLALSLSISIAIAISLFASLKCVFHCNGDDRICSNRNIPSCTWVNRWSRNPPNTHLYIHKTHIHMKI